MADLTKEEVIKILTLVIDDEASASEKSAFLKYIKNDSEMKKHYRQLLSVKNLVREKYKKSKAPSSLRQFVIHKNYASDPLLEDYSVSQSLSSTDGSESKHDNREKKINGKRIPALFRYFSAAAAILLFSILIIEFLDRSVFPDQNIVYEVESYAYNHFENHDGGYIEPTFQTASVDIAENYLSEFHSLQMTVPPVRSANFSGVVVSEFIPGYQTPLFEYYQEDLNEYIYIFAFHIPDLEKITNLIRDSAAVGRISSETDFHITEINGKHVVSWKWDKNWYAAVSNHNGYELASIIEPLNYISE